MTSGWTNERMDDLKRQVDGLGRRLDEGFVEQRKELNARFDRMEARFDKIDERFARVDERFNRTQEMVIGLHATITRLSLGLAAAAVGFLVTQL